MLNIICAIVLAATPVKAATSRPATSRPAKPMPAPTTVVVGNWQCRVKSCTSPEEARSAFRDYRGRPSVASLRNAPGRRWIVVDVDACNIGKEPSARPHLWLKDAQGRRYAPWDDKYSPETVNPMQPIVTGATFDMPEDLWPLSILVRDGEDEKALPLPLPTFPKPAPQQQRGNREMRAPGR